jgi:hypothetical protein
MPYLRRPLDLGVCDGIDQTEGMVALITTRSDRFSPASDLPRAGARGKFHGNSRGCFTVNSMFADSR